MSEPVPRAIPGARGFPVPGAVTPVSGGRDTAIFRVEHGGKCARRVFRPEQRRMRQREALARFHDLTPHRTANRVQDAGVKRWIRLWDRWVDDPVGP